jgi:RNA polymerase sigma-70 factor (ECF subfamily)
VTSPPPGPAGQSGAAGEPGPPGPDDLPTEASLLARAKAGDMAAFEQLAGAHADRLFAVLLRLLGDRAAAEDVAQEVMLRAWRGIGRFRGSSSFFTWLYRIAVNEASRSLARRARQPASVPIDDARQLPAPARQQPEQQAEQAELRRALGDALAALPPAQRTAVVLRDIEGLATRDAAEIAGVSQAAFKSRLHEARLKLRAALGDQALLDGM